MGRESAEKANRSLRSLLLALLSAALLIVAFPNFNQPWCAWIAFVPWLFLLRAVSRRAAFWWSYGIGLAFFLASMWWLIHVTVIGWLVLCACLALYFAVFGLIASRFFIHHPSSIIQRALLVPSAWVALEFLRSHLFSGLGWNLLAYSQTGWLPLIQIADLTGVWGVSFLIVMGNVALAELFTRGIPPAARWKSAAVAAVGVLLALGYGAWRISRLAGSGMLRVAVLQGNIPHDQTWDEAYRDSTLQRYQALTERAAATRPDVIVWPETTVPGYLGVDEEITQRVTALARQVRCPLLVGAPAPTIHDERITLMNSATLIDALGNLVARYDKMHLVAFGEFVPFDTWLPWLRGLLPPIGEFSPGHEYTVFHMGSGLRAQGNRLAHSPQPTALNSRSVCSSVLRMSFLSSPGGSSAGGRRRSSSLPMMPGSDLPRRPTSTPRPRPFVPLSCASPWRAPPTPAGPAALTPRAVGSARSMTRVEGPCSLRGRTRANSPSPMARASTGNGGTGLPVSA